MKKFDYTITNEVGIHARPAGLLVQKVKEFDSTVTIEKDGASCKASKLIALMGLGVKQGDTVTVSIEGSDEQTAAVELERFFKENL
ncbi:MAG: HPr family phosphocarrier protein [Ruminococcus sp.]|nr:HPr family phosphocarrier protein [Ruminococcus sp.]